MLPYLPQPLAILYFRTELVQNYKDLNVDPDSHVRSSAGLIYGGPDGPTLIKKKRQLFNKKSSANFKNYIKNKNHWHN